MCLDTDEAGGNMGMLDMVIALEVSAKLLDLILSGLPTTFATLEETLIGSPSLESPPEVPPSDTCFFPSTRRVTLPR